MAKFALTGSQLEQKHEADEIHSRQEAAQWRDWAVSAVLSVPLILSMLFSVLGVENGFASFLRNEWLQLAAAGSVQLAVGRRFYRSAFSFKDGMSTDALVSICLAAMFIFSVYNGFISSQPIMRGQEKELYFELSAVIMTLALLGKCLERRACGRALYSIKKLLTLTPESARIRRPEGEMDVPAAYVIAGDVVLVKQGDKIPADGEILNGLSSVDESMLTGESALVDKQPGDRVTCGTLNKLGDFEMRAEKTGEDTALANILRIAQKAQESKTPLQEKLDKALKLFVPAVIVIAVIAAFIWSFYFKDYRQAVISAVAVLIIASPRAVGLPVASAITFGIGKAAEKGILIKGGEQLENTCKLDTVLFDKTGAVTDGKPEVTDVIAFEGFFDEEVITFAAAAEKSSAHPIGRAIYGHTQPKVIMGGLSEATVRSGENEVTMLRSEQHGFIGSALPAAETVEHIASRGVKAVVGGRAVLVGDRKLMNDNGIEIRNFDKILENLESGGKTVVLVAIGGRPAGAVALSFNVKESSVEAVRKLEAVGMGIYMLTGGGERAAKVIGGQAGIDRVISGVSQQNKVAGITRLRESGKTVAMAGDGINDAAALSAADVGIAVGAGADVAASEADITLTGGDLNAIPAVIGLSKSVMGKIRQNMFFALAYNVTGIFFAACGLLSPLIAGFAAAFFPVLLIINSLKSKA